MKFLDELFKTGYFLNFSEKLFLFLIKFMAIVFAAIYYFNYFFVPDPTFGKFLFLYFLTFIVSGFFFTLLPLKEDWICALEFFKIPVRFHDPDRKLYEMASEKLASEARITPEEASKALSGSFASFKSDYFIVYPAWFFVLAALFVVEAIVFVKFDPVSIQKNFAILSAFLTLVHISAINSTFDNFSGLPGSTHSGFSIIFVCLFAVRGLFFSLIYKNAVFHCVIAAALAYSGFKLFSLLYYGEGVQLFAKTADKNIWRISFDSRMKRVIECEKIPFAMKCRFLKTPYSTAIAFYESGSPVSEFHFTPYRLGVEKESVETAARLFAERLKVSDGLKATGSVTDLFEEVTIFDLARKYGREQTAVNVALIVSSYLICYELFLVYTGANAFNDNYWEILRLVLGV